MRFALSLSLIALAIAGATAQLPTSLTQGLSTQCLGGVAGLIADPALNSCLDLTNALTMFSAAGSDSSLVPVLNTYLGQSICPKSPCSKSTLTTANTTIVSSCGQELQSGQSPVPGLLVGLMTNYDTIRKAACLQDTTASNQLCIVQTLTNIQTISGMNVSLNSLLSLNATTVSGLLTAVGQNRTAFCSDCNKGLITTLSPIFASSASNTSSAVGMLGSAFRQQCGNDSIGTVPTTLRASANGNSTSGNSTTGGSSSGGSSGSGSSGSGNGSGLGMSASLVVVSTTVMGLVGIFLVL